MELEVIDISKKVVGKENLSDVIVKSKFRPGLMHQYIVMQSRARRQGTHSTKTRAEVAGTGKKPYRQKGTGNARQGTLIGPHQVGGGIAFGPRPRSYEIDMPKKSKRLAVCGAISQKQYEGTLKVVSEFKIASGKTKDAAKILAGLVGEKSVLIVGSLDVATQRALKNLPKAKLLTVAGLNVEDILRYSNLLIVRSAISEIEGRLLTKKEAA